MRMGGPSIMATIQNILHSQMVPEKENKGVGIAQSITRLEPSRTFVEVTEDKASPAGPPKTLQPLKTVYLEEWAKIPPGH